MIKFIKNWLYYNSKQYYKDLILVFKAIYPKISPEELQQLQKSYPRILKSYRYDEKFKAYQPMMYLSRTFAVEFINSEETYAKCQVEFGKIDNIKYDGNDVNEH